MFASPSADAKISPGDEVEVMAVLIDPKLDIMIRRLSYTSPKAEKEGGNRVSLDPKVVFTRTNGEKVAEGVMSFG